MPPQKLDIKKNYEKSYCTTVGLVIPKLQPNRPAQLLIFKNLVSTYCCNFSLKIEITLILQVKKSYHISVFTKPLISVVAFSPYLSRYIFLILKMQTKCNVQKDQWDWYYLGRHNGFCSLGLTVLIPQKLRVYDQFNASYT